AGSACPLSRRSGVTRGHDDSFVVSFILRISGIKRPKRAGARFWMLSRLWPPLEQPALLIPAPSPATGQRSTRSPPAHSDRPVPASAHDHHGAPVAVESRGSFQRNEPQMRVGISGAHGTGKTTLAEALCACLTGHLAADDPYYLLEEEGYEFE